MKNLKQLLTMSVLIAVLLPSISYAELDGRGGVHWGLGRLSNKVNSIPERTMNTIDATVYGGWRFGAFLPVVYGEVRLVGQNTEASEVGDTNMKGFGYLLGLGLEYTFEK